MSNPNLLSKYMKPEHKRMSRALGYALTLDNDSGWNGFVTLAEARLSEEERAALAWASLRSLQPANADAVAKHVIGEAGFPLPSYLGGMGDARLWASYASRSELKAYALAATEAMAPKDQMNFRKHISEMEIAA